MCGEKYTEEITGKKTSSTTDYEKGKQIIKLIKESIPKMIINK